MVLLVFLLLVTMDQQLCHLAAEYKVGSILGHCGCILSVGERKKMLVYLWNLFTCSEALLKGRSFLDGQKRMVQPHSDMPFRLPDSRRKCRKVLRVSPSEQLRKLVNFQSRDPMPVKVGWLSLSIDTNDKYHLHTAIVTVLHI